MEEEEEETSKKTKVRVFAPCLRRGVQVRKACIHLRDVYHSMCAVFA